MEEEKKIRLLRADEIECRVAVIKPNGLSLLLYKDARVDQKILDEAYTPFGWRRSHQMIGGNLYCTVEVWDTEKNQWIGKQDVGTESYSEKEKGQASDSFKRACFNWGIGRELYSAPFIWIPADLARIEQKDGKYITKERFQVQSIGYDADRTITSLVIIDDEKQPVYTLKPNIGDDENEGPGEEKNTKMHQTKTGISKVQRSRMEQELRRTGVALEAVLERYRLQSEEEMTETVYKQAMKDLKASKSRSVA